MESDSRSMFYLDGMITTGSCPALPAEDRSFVFGDGVYEVIRVYGGRPFALDRHLRRLARSSEAIGLKLDGLRGKAIPPEVADRLPGSDALAVLRSLCLWLLGESGLADSAIYLQVSRGCAPRSHAVPSGIEHSLFVAVKPAEEKAPERLESGVPAITWVDARWLRCDIKSVNLLPNAMAKTAAVESGAYEAILYRVIDRVSGGFSITPVMTSSWGSVEASNTIVTEGSSSNVFIVRGGEVLTHPADNLILSGITRELVLEMCSEKGISVSEREFGLKELFDADEVFITGSGTEIAPVTSIDGRPVAGGKPGPVSLAVAAEYAELVARHREGREA